jgi:hypothetical protein
VNILLTNLKDFVGFSVAMFASLSSLFAFQ